MRKARFVRKIDNKTGEYTCKDCGDPLQSVAEYESPKGRKSEIRGICPNPKCVFRGATQRCP